MPNYFYTDSEGIRRGPVSDPQLQALAARGVITPATPLETEAGHKGFAGQIPNLNFPAQSAHVPDQTPPDYDVQESNTYSVSQIRYSSDTEDTSIFELLFDTSFRELRPETVFLWIMKILYVTGAIVIILASVWACGSTIYHTFAFLSEKIPDGASDAMRTAIGREKGWAFLMMLAILPCIVIGCSLGLCLLRFMCEWSIIVTHYTLVWFIESIKEIVKWIKEISKLLKAARIYFETKSKQAEREGNDEQKE